LAAAQRAGPSAMKGFSAGAANTSSRSSTARSMTLSATRTPTRGSALPAANTPYGRLSSPNSDPSGISTVPIRCAPLLARFPSLTGRRGNRWALLDGVSDRLRGDEFRAGAAAHDPEQDADDDEHQDRDQLGEQVGVALVVGPAGRGEVA